MKTFLYAARCRAFRGKSFSHAGGILRAFVVFVLVVGASGCATRSNLWRELERVVKPPDGVQQTQFALIGELEVPEGRYFVAHQKLVLTGMLAPRGQSKLLLFDAKRQLAASYDILNAYPLWCETSRIYLWGNGLVWNIPVDPKITELWPDSAEGGNVIDFSRGLHQPYITREKKYGSSGGIEDDPWQGERRYGSSGGVEVVELQPKAVRQVEHPATIGEQHEAIRAAMMALDGNRIQYGTPPTVSGVADFYIVTFPPRAVLPTRNEIVIRSGAVRVHVNRRTLQVEKIIMAPN